MIEVLDKFGVRGHGPWSVKCPAHEDRQASLSINVGDEGRVLLKCHAGCELGEILAAAGLTMADLFSGNGTNPSDLHPRAFDRRPKRPQADWRSLDACAAALAGDPQVLEAIAERRGWTPEILAKLRVGWDGKRFTLPVENERGELVGVCRYLPGGSPKMKADAGTPRQLWPAPEKLEPGVVWVVEGEPDAIAAHVHGAQATAVSGATNWKQEWAPRFTGRDVVICMDADGPGRDAARAIAQGLHDHAASVRIVDPAPEREDGYDLSDFLAGGGKLTGLLEAGKTHRRLQALPLADRVPRRIEWLYRGMLPLGEISVVAGAPGLGKSTFTAHLAGEISRDGDHVLLIGTEDHVEKTVLPRCIAAEADLRLVSTVEMAEDEQGGIEFPLHAEEIGRLVEDTGARLVVVDPIVAHLSDEVSFIHEQSVRRALAPLAGMAHRLNVAVVMVMHLNKMTTDRDPIARIGGAGFTGVCRAGLLFGSDPDGEPDSTVRYIAQFKNQYGTFVKTLKCHLETVPVPVDAFGTVDIARLIIDGTSDLTATDLLDQPPTMEERGALGDALQFLRLELASGTVTAKELEVRAKAAGISARTLQRARGRLGCKSERIPMRDGGHVYVVTLPVRKDT